MNFKILRRAVIMVMALMLIFACAASAATVYIMKDTISYSAPDLNAKQYGTIKAGFKAEMTASGYGWAKLEADGKVGYVRLEDVAKVTEYSGETVYVAAEADLLRTFDSNSKIISLEYGQAVKLYATAGDWSYIKASGKSGLVKTSRLSVEKPAAQVSDTSKSITAYVSVDGAKAYKSNSTSSRTLCSLSINDTVTVTAVSGKWARVEKNGYTGYMKTSQLSTEKLDEIVVETFTAYAKTDGAKVYDDWNSSAGVIKKLDINTEVTVIAYNSTWARVKINGQVAFMYCSAISREKVNTVPSNGSSATPATGTAQKADWWTSGISSKFSVGTIVTVTDVETGIAWREKRTGGTNHADCQPLTAADTAAMLKAYGGSWSWNRRAVFVTIDGVNYAASINGMPHGTGNSITDNNFDGHHCIHFTNSRTHGTNSVDSAHQSAVNKAAAATLK